MARYNKIFYRDKSITTLKQLFDKEKIVNLSIDDFLDIQDPFTGQTNREAIFTALSAQQRKKQGITSAKDVNQSTKISPPVTFWVTIDNIEVNIIKHESQFVRYKDVDAFLSEEIKEIINSNLFSNESNDYSNYTPQISVYLWSKTFDNKTTIVSGFTNGALVNLSSFIDSVTIGNYDTGGNFTMQISLVPVTDKAIVTDLDKVHKMWDIDTNFIRYGDKTKNNVIKTFVHKDDGVYLDGLYSDKRNVDFGTVGLNTNDIVFIKLSAFKKQTNNDNFYVDNNVLVDENFDMIALIDKVDVAYEPNEVTITITGRDLMKLISDDGSFFFPNSYSNEESESGVFINQTNTGDAQNTLNKYFNSGVNSHSRFVSTGLILPFFNPSARTIKAVVELVIGKLSNIQICPDDVFESYGNKRTKFLDEDVK